MSRSLAPLLAGTALLIAGCSDDDLPGGLGLPPRYSYPAMIESVTAPESVAVGDTIVIEARVVTRGGCERPEHASVTLLEPGHVRVMFSSSREFRSFICSNNLDRTVLSARVPVATPGTWRFDIVGQPPEMIEIVVTVQSEEP